MANESETEKNIESSEDFPFLQLFSLFSSSSPNEMKREREEKEGKKRKREKRERDRKIWSECLTGRDFSCRSFSKMERKRKRD